MRKLTREDVEIYVELYTLLYKSAPEYRPYLSWYFCETYGICMELYPVINSEH